MAEKKSLRKIKIKYPKISMREKALYKAVSRIPTNAHSNLPVAYAKAVPMIIGVITVLTLMFVPASRNATIEFSKNSFNNFVDKSEELADYFSLSMRAGVSAYVDQMKKYINPLPIDTEVPPKLYGGRIEVSKLQKNEMVSFSEKAHLMTARVSAIFED